MRTFGAGSVGLVLLALLACGACGDDEDPEAECLANGGLRIETDDGYRCAPATSDGGEPCVDDDDCEGFCQAPEGTADGATGVSGTCSEHTEEYCSFVVEDGVAHYQLCM